MTARTTRRRCLALTASATAAAWAGRGWAQTSEAGAAAVSTPGRGTVVIGQSAHLSGPLAPTFQGVLKGQQLAVDQFNARGGVNGRPVKLLTLDDGYDPRRCAENCDLLTAREKVVALTGLAATANIAAVLPMLAERQVPLVGVYSGTPTLRLKQHPQFFTTMASYRDEVVQMLRNLKTLQREQVVLVYQNAAFGQLMGPVVDEEAREVGVSIAAKVPLEANGSNAAAAAQAVGAANPQAIILMAFGPSIVPFVKAVRQQAAAPVYAISIANARGVIDALGDDARGLAITQTVPSPLRLADALQRDFAAVTSKAGVPADYEHFFGYVGLRVVLELLRRAGRTLNATTLAPAIERMGRVDLGGYAVTYGPNNHHGSKFVDITIIGPGGRYIR